MQSRVVSRLLMLALVGAGAVACSCGGAGGASDSRGTLAEGSSSASTTDPESPQGAASERVSPPPNVALRRGAEGGLALRNLDSEPVALRRRATWQRAEGAAPETLRLGVACSEPEPNAPGNAADDGNACLRLWPGAELSLGRWPDELGSCRCPPCLSPAPGVTPTITFATCPEDDEFILSTDAP